MVLGCSDRIKFWTLEVIITLYSTLVAWSPLPSGAKFFMTFYNEFVNLKKMGLDAKFLLHLRQVLLIREERAR